MITIDQLSYQSRLRFTNTKEKAVLAMFTLIFCVINRSIVFSCFVLLVMGILTVKKGGVPFPGYLHFIKLPFIFLILSTVAIVINLKPVPLDLFAIPLGNSYLTGSREALFYALQLILTALASVSCLYFLSMTTPVPDLLNLLYDLHCPRLLVELMLLIYRFIFVLLKTADSISLAQKSRLGNKDYRTSLKSFASLGSSLMVRAVKRSNALYSSMEARCYDGKINLLREEQPVNRISMFYIFLFELFLLIFTILRIFFL